jgi:DNA repair photolyase
MRRTSVQDIGTLGKQINPDPGRGALSNPDNRFEQYASEAVDFGWDAAEVDPRLRTQVYRDNSRSVIVYNCSPDVPFDRSINPYRGCEHGCVYCFARPTHAYLGCSPGLDFETRIFYKPDAASLLRRELSAKSYRCQPIALGVNTDAYQPVERRLGITRSLLEVLREHRHPVGMVTKSALIERDLDILGDMAAQRLAHVMVSVTTLDKHLARSLEPRAAAPQRRLEVVRRLAEAGIPVGVLMAPVIPFLNDSDIEAVLARARDAGALTVGYTIIRLPHEVKDLFREWLEYHAPGKAQHVMNRIRDMRGGRDNDAAFGRRMTGTGVFADVIRQRFRRALKRLDFPGMPDFDCALFRRPAELPPQLSLF